MRIFRLFIRLYFWALVIFGIFRAISLFLHRDEVLSDGVSGISDILSCFFDGMRFDLVTTGFILVLPYLWMILYEQTGKHIWKKISFIWIFIGFSMAFLLAGADVVYYQKFYQHIDLKTFEWFRQPRIVTAMIFGDNRYWKMIIPLVALIFILFRYLRLQFAYIYPHKATKNKRVYFHYFLFFLLIFLSLRGNLKNPLHIYDVYTLKNHLLNDLKINPLFYLEKSFEDRQRNTFQNIQLMDDLQAIRLVQNYLHIQKPVNNNPISRIHNSDSTPNHKNVVLIFMESMAAWKMARFGNQENRTPFLDSLFKQSIAFTRMYSNGIHTYAGIYGTLYGYPVIFGHHPFHGIQITHYYGLPQILRGKGYQTAFFIPHDNFDNLIRFLPENGYDTLFFKADYPKDSVRTTWGVDDHFLLQFAIKQIDTMAQNQKPFFATILTVTDHSPFYVPNHIKGPNIRIRATRFADWSLREFFRVAKTKKWFKHTIFVLIGDHGEGHRRRYPIPLTYNHIPAIIYYDGVKPLEINRFSHQVDIGPTLLNLLGISHLNTTFGIDLFHEKRPYTYFNHDQIYALIDSTHLLLITPKQTLGLYRWSNGDLYDYRNIDTLKRKAMESYLKAHIQTAKYILQNHWQDPKNF